MYLAFNLEADVEDRRHDELHVASLICIFVRVLPTVVACIYELDITTCEYHIYREDDVED